MLSNLVKSKRSALLQTAAAGVIASLTMASPAHAIVPNDNFTPADIIDETGANGVGMFFRNDGFVCTGTLINPRTVLFAAHCVNDRPESDYGPIIRSAFSFDDNALPGFISWINNGFSSFPDQFVYDISQIYYNPQSVERPDGLGFLEADIALASLTNPVTSRLDNNSLTSTIPMWALLFSPLPTPATIDPVTGTGYHVNITGYGRSGSGTTGASQGIDWRRRAAENMLGSLTSFDNRNLFLFGNPFGDLPQVLYRLDFDDPNKTNPFDFNLYKDEPTTREGTTAGGDSGGPLVLDAANNSLSTENLQIGVLSGGTRFFGAQVFSSYGTESFFQPLFPFWDYIVATNPYRYVSAVAGDGAWEDPNHWQTDLDPIYRIINSNGAVVNGLPTTVGGGRLQDTPEFGEVCFDPEGPDPSDGCQDLATGNATPPVRETGGAINSGIGQANLPGAPNAAPTSDLAAGGEVAASSVSVESVTISEAPAAATPELAEEAAQPDTSGGAVSVEAASGSPGARSGMIMGAEHQAHNGNSMILGGDNIAQLGVELAEQQPQNNVELAEEEAQNDGGPETAEEQPQASDGGEPEFTDTPNPPATIENGLPGATGFVPNNIDGGIGQNGVRRYFEVSLNQAGTTTLSSAVTIDKLNVTGAAGLSIGAAGNLTSLIDINQTGGRIDVNGSLTTNGDYLLALGVLSGNGTVNTPFLTSVAGMIAPGSVGTIGTLNVNGNVVLSSGSTFLVDIGANGNSDQLVVNGNANVGGTVMLTPAAGFQTVTQSVYKIVRTTNGGVITGTFNDPAPISAILQTALDYQDTVVFATVAPQPYSAVIDPLNPVQVGYAALMDPNRGNPALANLFAFLDFASAATIQATFDSWAPTTESTAQSLARGFFDQISSFHQNRISFADRGSNGGTIATIGRPVQLAAASLGGFGVTSGSSVLSDAAVNAADTEVKSGAINEDMAIYLSGGFINGDGGSMPLRNPPAGADGEDEFDGFFIAGGLEYYLDDETMIGGSIYYSDVDSTVVLGNTAEGQTIMGSIYGRGKTFWDLVFDARVSIGTYNLETARSVNLGAQAFNLTTDDDSLVFASEIGLSKELDLLGAIIAPGIRGRAAKVNFDTVSETGGGPALTLVRPDYNSLQGLAGAEFRSKPGRKLQMRASMHYVHEFLNDNPSQIAANFVGGVGPLTGFALVNPDRNWGEASVGVRYNSGNVSFDLSADTTLGRSDVDSQVYSGAVTFRF